MNEKNALVFIVDDDRGTRESLRNLIRSAGLSAQTFSSAQEFLAAERPKCPSCLVLDVQLPGLSGLDLQRELAKAGVKIPIIFITGHGDIPTSVRAIKAGALEFLTKPVNREDLLRAIQQAIARDDIARQPNGDTGTPNFGDIPLELQTKLLRVLQEREFERLGSTRTLRTDARLIAATNRELQKMVEQRKFREDLFYRLNVFPISVPALRERPEDIPLLVNHFAQHFARRMKRTIETIPVETMAALTRYPWPGNIRELQNLIERAVILSHGPVLQIPLQDVDNGTQLRRDDRNDQTLVEAQRAHILAILKETRWVLAGPRG